MSHSALVDLSWNAPDGEQVQLISGLTSCRDLAGTVQASARHVNCCLFNISLERGYVRVLPSEYFMSSSVCMAADRPGCGMILVILT